MIKISSILNLQEHATIEVKAASGGLPNSIWETYSSFANTFGGIIILGIAKEKQSKRFIPIGVQNADQMILDIWNILNNHLKVSANILLEHHVYKTEYNDMQFVVIEVPRADRRDKPIYIGKDMLKGTFKRNYEGDYRCTLDEVKSMLRDQADTSQDSLILENLRISDLNQESIRRYRILFNNLKENHVWTPLPDDEFLLKIGAARISQSDRELHPTLGGLIFFGDFITITNELPYYFLDYRENLSSDTRWTDRVCSGDGTWSGNIFDFYFKIIDRITADAKRPFQLNYSLLRIDDTSIHKSLRECLANALIHADYYGRQGIVINKEFRKVTISNPGLLRISLDEAIAGGISDSRNTRIFNMFSLINVGESSGSGLCTVFHTWEKHGLSKPKMVETINPDRTTITLKFSSDGISDVINDGINDGINFNLKKTENIVYTQISNNPDMTVSEIARVIQVSKPTVERAITTLKKKGFITREGSNKTGTWVTLKH